MSTKTKIVAGGALAVLILDSVGAGAARALGFSYLPIGLAAYVVYALVGGFAGARLSVAWGALAGACAATVHASLGYWIAAQVGPASVAVAFADANVTARLVNVVFSSILGGLLGAIGAGLGRLRRRG